MSRGYDRPRILSPGEAEGILAVPCVLILARVAQAVFTLGFRGSPSPVVLIVKVKANPPIDWLPSTGLPVPVQWEQWRSAVVPVLEDDRWSFSNPLIRDLLASQGGKGVLVGMVGSALRESFVLAGYGP